MTAIPKNLAAAAKNNPAILKELQALQKAARRGAISSQRVKSTLFYWSKVRLAGSVSAGILTFARSKVSAFSYQLNGPMDSAGLTVLGNATEAETNLEQANNTNSGETVQIIGVGVQLAPDTDAEIAKMLSPHVATRIVRANGTPTRLGPISTLPGGGGIFGGSASRVIEPPLGQATVERGVVSNGYPSSLNYRQLSEPIVWTKTGTTDGVLAMEFELVRSLTLTLPSPRSAAAGVAAYAQPTTGTAGTYLDLYAYFFTTSTAPRSANG